MNLKDIDSCHWAVDGCLGGFQSVAPRWMSSVVNEVCCGGASASVVGAASWSTASLLGRLLTGALSGASERDTLLIECLPTGQRDRSLRGDDCSACPVVIPLSTSDARWQLAGGGLPRPSAPHDSRHKSGEWRHTGRGSVAGGLSRSGSLWSGVDPSS